MALTVAINGFGRIGRNVLRQIYGLNKNGAIKIAAINDLTDNNTLAHLLKYDSAHGPFKGEVAVDGDALIINGDKIAALAERDPASLPWKQLGVDVVLECTGIFRKKAQASAHLEAGAKKVIISAPSPDPDATIAIGVNTEDYKPAEHNIISCASCTTNCLAPVAKVLLENYGITRGTMTTIHSYTNDQSILDLPHKDLRRARSAAVSMIPTTTGAAKAVGLVLPALKGKVDGFAVRVPTPNVSLVDFVAEVEQDVTVEDVNRSLKAASEGPLKGILGFSEEPLVSVDYMSCPNSSTVDAALTMVVGNRLVKVVTWYDNEMGFSTRMVDACELIAASL